MPRNRTALRLVLPFGEWIDMRKPGLVKTSLPIAGSADRAVLFNWASSDEPRLQNVARVDRHGNVLWRADLPGDAARDCFVSLEADGAAYLARTYSGQVMRFSSDTDARE